MKSLVLELGIGNGVSISDSRTLMAANPWFGRVLAAGRRIRDIHVWIRGHLAAVGSTEVLI